MTTPEITKVQELIYTTKVETVMAPNVVVIEPSMSMADVKELMRSKRITGVPVLDGDRIVGIISMTDVIEAMEKGRLASTGGRQHDAGSKDGFKGRVSDRSLEQSRERGIRKAARCGRGWKTGRNCNDRHGSSGASA